MPSKEEHTLQQLISFLHVNESPKTFKQKRSFIFNFSLLWNLFEDKCMNNFAKISEVNAFVDNLKINNSIDIDEIYNYFRNRYVQNWNSPIYFDGLLWRHNEERYKNTTIEVLNNETASVSDKLKAILYIIFRLRNNLFHGEKDISIINEQKQTFVLVNKFLIDIIKLQGNN